MLEHLRKKSDILESQCPIILGETGNTVSASIPMVLAGLLPGMVAGDRVILIGFGVGLSWGISLITWDGTTQP
jgi:3-oxoacyl-[acyl-carrier-protein] synthase-3